MVPEYFNNILRTNSHIQGTCISENFESNGAMLFLYYVLKVDGAFVHQSYRRQIKKLAIYNLTIIDHLKALAYTAKALGIY